MYLTNSLECTHFQQTDILTLLYPGSLPRLAGNPGGARGDGGVGGKSFRNVPNV